MRPSGQQVKSDSAHALCPTADWSTRLFNSNPIWPRPLSPSKEGHVHVSDWSSPSKEGHVHVSDWSSPSKEGHVHVGDWSSPRPRSSSS